MSAPPLRAPGLYLRALEAETPAEAQTAVTALVGAAARGPLDSPQTVRNWGEFTEVFGGPAGFGVLAGSAYAFFQNGGAEACVVRVGRELPPAPAGPCPDREPLAAAAAASPILDADGGETLRLRAKHPGAYGNRVTAAFASASPRDMDLGALAAAAAAGATQAQVDFVQDFTVGGNIRLVHRDNSFLRSDHKVLARDPATGLLTLDPALPRDYPRGSRTLGRGFSLRVAEGDRTEAYDDLSMNPAHPNHVASMVNGPEGLQELDAARQGHSLLVRVEQVFGAGGQSRGKPADTPTPLAFAGGGDGLTLATGALADAALDPVLAFTAKPRGRAGDGVSISASAFGGRLALAADAGQDKVVVEDIRGWSAGDALTLTDALNPALTETASVLSADADSHILTLSAPLANAYSLASPLTTAARFNLSIALAGAPAAAETFPNLSLAPGPRFVETQVNGGAGSALACVHVVSGAVAMPVGTVALSGGTDPNEMEFRRYLGYEADGGLYLPGGPDAGPVGLAALESRDEVNLVCIPDVAALPGVDLAALRPCQSLILGHCRKLGDRFALLDPPAGIGPDEAWDWPGGLQDGSLPRYGAAYYPWLVSVVEGDAVSLPPSGAVAGLIAGVDARQGVGKAPGNEAFKGALAPERDLDADAQGDLNLRGVNVIRKFESGAIRLYGARSLSPEDGQLYVHNRRLVVAVIKALTRNLRWAVFEPNDERLRRRVKDSLDGYFQGLLAQGLTAGTKPDEAYYVKVDDETNTADTAAAGQLIAEVGLALSRPAEFIVITVKRRPEILALVEEEA